jgi:hypothetical protein
MAGGVAVVQSRRDGERGTIMAAMRDTAPLPTAAGSVSPARESVGESRTAASPPLPPRRPARARATSPAPSEPPQPPMREPAARGEALAMADSTAPRPMRSRYAGAAAGASNVAPTVGATVAANVATRQAMVPTRQADAEYRAEAALGSIGAAPAAPKAVLGRAGVADTIVGSVPTASAQSPAFAASARRSPARSIVAMDVASRVGATGCYTLSATRAAPDEGAPTPTRLELTAVDESAGSRLARGSTPPAREKAAGPRPSAIHCSSPGAATRPRRRRAFASSSRAPVCSAAPSEAMPVGRSSCRRCAARASAAARRSGVAPSFDALGA